MNQNLQLAAVRAIASRRGNPLVALGARAARAYLRCYGNFDYDSTTNGEERVLRIIGGFSPTCILDVGANVGDWTVVALRQAPAATVHCFEVVPDTASALRSRVGSEARVRINEFGLADREGTVAIRYFPEASAVSGIDPVYDSGAAEVRTCRVDTGDRYCEQNEIERIDLLKIDVEGAEGLVLDGFKRVLAAGRVEAVQFEYGLANIKSATMLRDLYRLLEGYGFTVGKVFPRGVEFRPYALDLDEDFLGPNYVAVQRSRTEMIRALSGHLV